MKKLLILTTLILLPLTAFAVEQGKKNYDLELNQLSANLSEIDCQINGLNAATTAVQEEILKRKGIRLNIIQEIDRVSKLRDVEEKKREEKKKEEKKN
jgi:multidrug resistance efflux pump